MQITWTYKVVVILYKLKHTTMQNVLSSCVMCAYKNGPQSAVMGQTVIKRLQSLLPTATTWSKINLCSMFCAFICRANKDSTCVGTYAYQHIMQYQSKASFYLIALWVTLRLALWVMTKKFLLPNAKFCSIIKSKISIACRRSTFQI